jgi:hypothetical protein
MTPQTLPDQGTRGKRRNPFDDLPDVPAPTSGGNPFDTLDDPTDHAAQLRAEVRRQHQAILDRNEAGKARDRDEAEADSFVGQLRAGGRDVVEAVRHPWETVKGMAGHAAADAVVAVGSAAFPNQDDSEEQQAFVDRARLNTAANIALPLAPELSIVGRSAVNASLGAVNMPEQPIRGATAGLLLGEGLHRVGGARAEKVDARPKLRLDDASPAATLGAEARARYDRAPFDPAFNADFAARLERDAIGAVPGRETVDRVAGYQPTALPDRPLKPNPRNPAGFTPESNPFDAIPDATGKRLEPVPVETPDAPLARAASDDQFRRDLEEAATPDPELVRGHMEDARQEELTRQAALRALTGVRRRPKGIKPAEPAAGPAPEGPGIDVSGPPPIKLTGEEIAPAGTPIGDLQRAAREYARQHFKGRTYNNPSLDADVGVSMRGIKKALSHAADPEQAKSMAGLDQMIEQGQHVESAGSRTPAEQHDVVAYHYLEAPITIGDRTHVARVVVKELKDGHLYYDHTLNEAGGGNNEAGARRHFADRAAGQTRALARRSVEPRHPQRTQFRAGGPAPTALPRGVRDGGTGRTHPQGRPEGRPRWRSAPAAGRCDRGDRRPRREGGP